jgi:hypothetical protein
LAAIEFVEGLVGGTGKAQPSNLKDLVSQTPLRAHFGAKGVLRNTYKPHHTLIPKRTGKHAEVDGRYAWARREARKQTPSDRLMVINRVREVRAVLATRYGDTLPDDDAGREGLVLLLSYVAQLNPGNAIPAIAAEARLLAPWMPYAERRAFAESIVASPPRKLKADTIAEKLDVTYAERTLLGLTTIGCYDLTRAERNKLTRCRKTDNERERRRRSGVKSRGEYLASLVNSAENTEPWKAAGMSRATWYRRSKAERESRETGSVATVKRESTPAAHPVSGAQLSGRIPAKGFRQRLLAGMYLVTAPLDQSRENGV